MDDQRKAILVMGLIGVFMFVIGSFIEEEGGSSTMKWLGVIFLVIPVLTLFKIAILG